MELNRFIDVISLLPQHVEASISQFVQSFGAAPFAALLLIPIFVAASSRKSIPALAVTLLSFVSLMLIVAPASATGVLGVASGLGSFLASPQLVWVIFGQISSGCLLLLLSLWACGQRACVVHHVHGDVGARAVDL